MVLVCALSTLAQMRGGRVARAAVVFGAFLGGVRSPNLLYNPAVLTKIALKNFKLHADTEIEAAPITVFIGPNNSGKSSIFQSLLLWRQAARVRNESHLCIGWKKGSEPYVFTEDQLVDIGEFEQVVRRKEREVSIGVSGSYPPDKNIEYGPGPTHGDFEIRVRENNLVYQHGELDCEVASFDFRGRVKWDRTAGQSARQFNLPVPVKNVTLNFNPVDALSLLGGTGYTFQGSLTPEEGVAFQELSNRLGQSVRKLLGSIHPVFFPSRI